MFERIMIAVDGTPNEGVVVDHAVRLATHFDATVRVLHVTQLHYISEDVVAGSGLGVVTGEGDVDPRDRGLVADLVERLRSAGVKVTGEVVNATEHDTGRAISERAKETG